MNKRTKAILLFITALAIAAGVTLMDVDRAQDGQFEAYRGQRSAWN